MSVTLGQPVPDFTAEATSNTNVKLSELKGRKVVLFFYPKDNTPGCTSE
ncbi:MAG: redoxin domain-containing protein, partial [Endozoicomonas sp.]